MPDHVHLLVEGASSTTSLPAFVGRAKQASGYEFARRTGSGLWPPSYYDRALRREDSTPSVIRYIVENPVRAGLVSSPIEYPYTGVVYGSIEDVLTAPAWTGPR